MRNQESGPGCCHAERRSEAKCKAERHGLALFNVNYFPTLAITDGLPGRDADIEYWLQLLAAMGRLGIPTMGYNFKHGNFRTTSATGRGGARSQGQA